MATVFAAYFSQPSLVGKSMTFPDPDAIKGAISSLKDIVSRSQSDNGEGVRMLRQIEATVLDIEVKTSFAKAVSGVSSITSVSPVSSVPFVGAVTPIVTV